MALPISDIDVPWGGQTDAADGPTEGFLRLRERVYASGCGKERHGANGEPAGAVNDLHDSLCAKETSSNAFYTFLRLCPEWSAGCTVDDLIPS